MMITLADEIDVGFVSEGGGLDELLHKYKMKGYKRV
jgi:hypothetical protein